MHKLFGTLEKYKLACCWLPVADAEVTDPDVGLAAVMTPPVILNVVVPGLDRCPAAVTVFTEPSDSFTCAPWEPPTTCREVQRLGEYLKKTSIHFPSESSAANELEI